ncbi:MAG TPA: DUF2793 domain-containing protein [candidate division Zixibacteria bacterium]|nr:DUF2793 domain-containing protein [candidate division Zixibacteria bacterium]
MADTPKLTMPEISESQASKYLTHNEALRILDGLVQATVKDKDLTTPPGSPSDGDMYIVGSPTDSNSGDWNGHDDDVAYYKSSGWVFWTPQEGWRVYVQDEDTAYVYASASSGWQTEGSILAADFTDLGDTPSSYSGQGSKLLRVKSAEDGVEFTDNSYDIGSSFNGKPSASEVLLRIPFTRDVNFPDDLSGSQGVLGTAPTAQADFAIKKNGVEFATMSFAGSATTATFSTSSSDEDFTAGDVLTVEAPSSQDATLADIGFLLKGTKT